MMKKKLGIILASIVAVIALAALAVFALSGNREVKTINLAGIWKVTSSVLDGTVTVPQDEYMIFDGETASDYRDKSTSPYVTSAYKVNGDVLELADISRTYHLAVHTDSYISLYTSENTFLTIVKTDNEEILHMPFDPSSVTGKWHVDYRPTDKPIQDEYLVFGEKVFADYRDNSEVPAVEAEYQWNDNIIQVPSLGIEMVGARVADDRIVLIDTNEGFVWLLTQANN